jgi:hypothetical protein
MLSGRSKKISKHATELKTSDFDLCCIRMFKSRSMGGVGHVTSMGEKCKILFGKPEGRRLLGRLRSTWEDNIRVDLGDTE